VRLSTEEIGAGGRAGGGVPWRALTVRPHAPFSDRERFDNQQMDSVLDSSAKSATPPPVCDEDGVITDRYDPLLKWQLQAVARLALGVCNTSVPFEQRHRIRCCHRVVRQDKREVQVRESEKSKKAYYANLQTCGSVWTCPVCAPKIQAVRAAEVRQATDNWTAQGGAVVLLTQTVPHTRQDALEPLLDAFTLALSKFKAGSPYKRLADRYGIVGSIRALEVTHGANGWHPHAHSILFLRSAPISLEKFHADLFRLWESAARRAGFKNDLSPTAFNLQDASAVKTYVTKMGTEYVWNAEHELVKAHSKRGTRQSLTPFDMLRCYLDAPDEGRLLALFAEYAHTFHGRRQLVWSDGLRKLLLGTAGQTDEQIAASIGEADPILAHIPLEDWHIINRHKLQGEVLQIVQEHGQEGLKHLLSVYRRPPNATRSSTPDFWVDDRRPKMVVAHY
jgi:hypothetical protein